MIVPMKTFVNPKYVQDADGNNVSVDVEIDGIVHSVPMADDNADWEQMSQQVADGTLTIQDAD
jgi:hypothetical protein